MPQDREIDDPASLTDMTQDLRYVVPQLASWYTPRPRLVDRLDSVQAPLVLVSAPAGSGKTSLVAEWLRRGVPRAAWVTLDDGVDVWHHVVACLEGLGVKAPSPAGTGVDTRGARPVAMLAAAIGRQEELVTLVLDGYELASAEDSQCLDFLLRHAQGRLRVVLITRVDPLLPLYRYRLDESVVELRAADLAFTDPEAERLVRRSGAGLGTDQLHELNTQLRGWAAGLRLAARTLATHDDPNRYVPHVVAASGDVGAYLLGEVLDSQKPDVRAMLLRTSVVDILYPVLADALVERPDRRTVDTLTKINAFLEPVDEELGCYRYYPFFRDLLRAQLSYENHDLVEELHRTAAQWYAREGMIEASLTHLAAIEAWSEAADLLVDSLAVGRLIQEGREGPIAVALAGMRGEGEVPRLVRAALALAAADVAACGAELAAVRARSTETLRTPAFLLTLAVLTAAHARYATDPHEAAGHAEVARHRLSEYGAAAVATCPELVGLVCVSGGLARFRLGDLAAAAESFSNGALACTPDCRSIAVDCLGYAALVDSVLGRLHRATEKATEAIALADTTGTDPAAPHVALAWTALEQYDLDVARRHVARALRTSDLPGDVVSGTLLVMVRAGLLRSRGRLSEAVNELETALMALRESDTWLCDMLRADLARTKVALGQPQGALADLEGATDKGRPEVALAAAEAQLASGEDPPVAHIVAATGSRAAARNVQIATLLLEAERSTNHATQGRAIAVLHHSLRMAAPESIRRPFHETWADLRRLLTTDPGLAAEGRWLTPATSVPAGPAAFPAAGARTHRSTATPEVVEQLTSKEVEVLGHLAALLSTDEIAEAMFVSRNTVRTHIRSILRKLGVSRRNLAVRRAQELGLLAV